VPLPGQRASSLCSFDVSPGNGHKAKNSKGERSRSRRGCHLLFLDGTSHQQTSFTFFLETIAFTLDIEGGGIMQETVKDGSSKNGVVENLTPIEEAFVAGDDETGTFIATGNQAEKETGFVG